jgi:hypothetical protein
MGDLSILDCPKNALNTHLEKIIHKGGKKKTILFLFKNEDLYIVYYGIVTQTIVPIFHYI